MNQKKPMPIPSTRKDFMIVNMGPHHPSMHGVLRLIVTLDVVDDGKAVVVDDGKAVVVGDRKAVVVGNRVISGGVG
ncbi:hypothetical protein Ccrd_023942 [Cynara cardunculus var. scolymus]|uniref:NAD(P)H dehydrogenase subunit H n=1 Tax=Cynara cardunculus var. scolymus TaxID=59895 RepID=A0A118JSE5_CYNCS|nr:hypothetical protein Ccrd_023942 [Cynara cardunculus var. scolymus]